MSSYKRAIVVIKDEVNINVSGLLDSHRDTFYDMFREQSPNYFFNPKYKLGVWDGYINFFHKNGNSFFHLLPEIIPSLIKWGYDPVVRDRRRTVPIQLPLIDKDYLKHIINEETDEPWELRYYQVDAINAMTKNGGGITVAGTGSGKSIINAVLVDLYAKEELRSITIVPNQDLIRQTKETFVGIGLDTGEYSGTLKDTDHTHVVSTWQALQNNPRIVKDFQVVVVDEVHLARANVLKKILSEHGNNISYRFGLTGTLPKHSVDRLTVKINIGNAVYEIPAHRLIEENYLANLNIEIYQLKENFQREYEVFMQSDPQPPITYNRFKNTYFPEWTHENQYLQTNKNRLEWIGDLVAEKQKDKKGNMLVLVSSIKTGKKLEKIIPEAVFLSGKDKQDVRKEAYDTFKTESDTVVIATVHIAGTGLNIRRVNYVVMVDIGKSFIRTIQTIGRGLRKAHDKEDVTVIDVASDLKYSKKHLNERIKYYKEAKYPHKKHSVDY